MNTATICFAVVPMFLFIALRVWGTNCTTGSWPGPSLPQAGAY